jgi:hypothetical protein
MDRDNLNRKSYHQNGASSSKNAPFSDTISPVDAEQYPNNDPSKTFVDLHHDLRELPQARVDLLENILEKLHQELLDWEEEEVIAYLSYIWAHEPACWARVERAMYWHDGHPNALQQIPWSRDARQAYRRGLTAYLAQHPELATAASPVAPAQAAIVWQKATDLLNEELPPLRWCVPELLPEGLATLAGRPKQGKSLFALNLAVAVSTGGVALGTYPVEEAGDVAYVCLEDGKRRVKERLQAMLPPIANGKQPDRLSFTYRAPRIDQGLVQALEAWVTTQAKPALIVIDIWARVAPVHRHGLSYTEECRDFPDLMDLAERHHPTILLVTHTTKLDREDVFDSMQGSRAVRGSTITNMVLKHSKGKASAELHVESKDLPEDQELALELRHCCWSVLGGAEEYRMSKKRQAVLDLLAASPHGLSIKDLAELLEEPYGRMKLFLWRMGGDGYIELNAKRRYRITASFRPPQPPPADCDPLYETNETLKPETDDTGSEVSSESEVSCASTTRETSESAYNTEVTEKVSEVSQGSSPQHRYTCPRCGPQKIVTMRGQLRCYLCDYTPPPLAKEES